MDLNQQLKELDAELEASTKAAEVFAHLDEWVGPRRRRVFVHPSRVAEFREKLEASAASDLVEIVESDLVNPKFLFIG